MTAHKDISARMLEHQKAILASLIVNPSNYFSVKDKVAPMMFNGALEGIASFIFSRLEEQRSYDLPALRSQFDDRVLKMIMESVTTRDMIPEHAERLHDIYMAMRHEEMTYQVMEQVQQGTSFSEALADATAQMEVLRGMFATGEDRASVFSSVMDDILEAQQSEGILGVPTGWENFDKYLSGFLPSTYYGLIARPGMGKTTVFCTWVDYQLRAGYKVAFFAMGDQPKKKVIKKLASMRTGIPFAKIISGNLDDEELQRVDVANNELFESGLYIYDVTDVKAKRPYDLADKIYDLKRQGIDIDVVYVDYVQQMKPQDKQAKSLDARLTDISECLQTICGVTGIPFVVASQLNRALETRGGTKRPGLSDIRGSGSLEQDFRVVFGLYRPEYYNILEDEEGFSLKGITEIMLLKNDVRDELPMFRVWWKEEKLSDHEPGIDFGGSGFPKIDNNLITKPSKRNDDADIPF